jgi:AbrB family looped-hinge helix DNA binding protein
MKVTIKGQITVPLALRERYGLHPGTEVEFEPEAGGLRVKARKRTRKAATAFDAWLVHAAGSSTSGLSTDKIMAMTRGED